ncbi:TlpA family protein disulfide reductase [Kitasatospora sp. NPDC093550]|uniref:TlpA family protein disulfide reductase n=1 Tax=Kitasatospora sp. NPDC093550 TaxID=3364089 RepID=UPI0038292B6B
MAMLFIVIIGCLSLFNLVLTLALARKINTRGSAHGSPASFGNIRTGVSVPDNRIPDGAPVPEFRAPTAGGEVTRADLVGAPAVVGFFSGTCGPCLEQAPDFVKAVTGYPGGRERVLAVVKGSGPVVTELRTLLEPVARVSVETSGAGTDSTAEAFGIVRWPSYVSVDADGRITHHLVPGELVIPTAAR